VTTSDLRLGDAVLAPLPARDAWANGFDALYKRSGPKDLFLVPLANAATPLNAREASVSFDGLVPYRIVVEVLFTLAQSEIVTWHLLVSSGEGKVASIDLTPPRADQLAAQAALMQAQMSAALGGPASPAPSAPAPRPAFTVLLVNDGIGVKGIGGNVAPGCKDVGPGLTFPKKAGAYDFAGLAECGARLAATIPASASSPVTYAANPDVDFQSLVHAIDAMRASLPGVQLGLAR
jgi:hypothetical protein